MVGNLTGDALATISFIIVSLAAKNN